MEYYFNELGPFEFQRLINTILVYRLGEDARITPLFGPDGGRDGETASGNPYITFEVRKPQARRPWRAAPRPGRYIFQCKFHRTTDSRPSDSRRLVLRDFSDEIRNNILSIHKRDHITYFFLVTNVPASNESIAQVDVLRRDLLREARDLHVDIWWKDQVAAYLDLLPSLWTSFPSLFAGSKVPLIAEVAADPKSKLGRSIRIAIRSQYNREKLVRFRQIELAKELSRLFVDLDVDWERSTIDFKFLVSHPYPWRTGISDVPPPVRSHFAHTYPRRSGALEILLEEGSGSIKRIILEGGPGQGKSTLTQMAAQIYRQQLLGEKDFLPEERWREPTKIRLPFRIELRQYAEQLARNDQLSLEQYLASTLSTETGGEIIDVAAIHDLAENSPILLILDGLDEIGSDELRDLALERAKEAISRFEHDLQSDLRVIITSRPPAIAGRQAQIATYSRVSLAALSTDRVNDYLKRWLNVQLHHDEQERQRVYRSFDARRNEPHVEALIKNPMQLSVLLHFVYLKGDAFPGRRAELYQEYFKIVIDRDVEKSPDLRKDRDLVEALHRFLGFQIHVLTEAKQADGSLVRSELLAQVGTWLENRGDDQSKAHQLFKLGEERLGLVVVLRGEGASARYGFEIQPIREYFAASHINEILEINAHDLFEKMVRRPFWREVALFLAGLRRENERADLVARARSLDEDADLGWRLDGRDIILQLTKEGVLSQPRHVLSESLDFLLDILDQPRPIQIEPKELLNVLPNLLATEGLERHRARLRRLLENHSYCDDEKLITSILLTASRALPNSEFMRYLTSFRSRLPELMARLRIRIPYEAGLEDWPPISNTILQEGIEDHVWAREWWLAAYGHPDVAKLSLPDTLHKYLIERFAFGDIERYFRFGLSKKATSFPSQWAAWRLRELLLLLADFNLGASGSDTPSLTLAAQSLEIEPTYTGLEEPLREQVQALVTTVQAVLRAIITNKPSDRKRLASSLSRLLDEPGLAAWIGITASWPFAYSRHSNSRIFSIFDEVDSASILGKVDSLVDGLRPGFTPNSVRLKSGEIIPLSTALYDSLMGQQVHYDWLLRMPITSNVIRSMLDDYKEINETFLKNIGTLELKTWPGGRPLRTSQLQRVLAVARRTDDPDVLAGCISAISGSRFIRLGGEDLLLKLLAHIPRGKLVAALVFRGLEEPEAGTEEILLLHLADQVLANAQRFESAVVTAALNFRMGRIQKKLPSLAITEEFIRQAGDGVTGGIR